MVSAPKRGQHVNHRKARSARPKNVDVGQTQALVQTEMTHSQGTLLGQQTGAETSSSSAQDGEVNSRRRSRRPRTCYRMPKPTSGKEMYETERQIRQASAENARLVMLQREREQQQIIMQESLAIQHQIAMQQPLQQHYGWDEEQQSQQQPMQNPWDFNGFSLDQPAPPELWHGDQRQYQAPLGFHFPQSLDQTPHTQQLPTLPYVLSWEGNQEAANQPLQPESTIFDQVARMLMNAEDADPGPAPAQFAPELFINESSMLPVLRLQPEMHYDGEAIFPTTLYDNHSMLF